MLQALEVDTTQQQHETTSITQKTKFAHQSKRPRPHSAFGCTLQHPNFHLPTKNPKGDKTLSPGPGPGQYDHFRNSIGGTSRKKGGSVSIRGYTPLISLDPRFGSDATLREFRQSLDPGPGSYTPNLQSIRPVGPKVSFGNKKGDIGDVIRRDVSQKLLLTSRNHRSKKLPLSKSSSPGPGHYDLTEASHSNRGINRNNLGAASFKFTSRKDSHLILPQHHDVNLAVGMYDISKTYDFLEKLGKERRRGREFPDSTFSSTSKRFENDYGMRFGGNRTIASPAPGEYFNEIYESMAYHEDMYRPSACFRSDLDRSGRSNNIQSGKQEDESPGPGSYGTDITYINEDGSRGSACFASTSTRFQSLGDCDSVPGPQSYYPQIIERQSFFQNRYHQWV